MEYGIGKTAQQSVPEVLNRDQENECWQDPVYLMVVYQQLTWKLIFRKYSCIFKKCT